MIIRKILPIISVLCVVCCYARADDSDPAVIANEVSLICGSSLGPVPKILKISEQNFWLKLKETAGTTSEPSSRGLGQKLNISAFYEPIGNVILINPTEDEGQNNALVVSEISQFRRLQLFHEMVHAWQYHNYGEALKIAKGSPSVKQAVLEGYAEYATWLYCKRHGMVPLYDRLLANREAMREIALPEGARDVYFNYVESFHFFEYLCAKDPEFNFKKMLDYGLPTDRQLVFPEEYQNPRKGSPDLSALQRLCEMIDGTPLGSADSIDLAEFRMYLRRNRVPNYMIQNIIKEFAGAVRAKSKGRDVTALVFYTAVSAQQVFEIVREQQQQVVHSTITVQHPVNAPSLSIAVHSVAPLNQPTTKSEYIELVADGSVVLEIDDRADHTALTLSDWANQMSNAYLKADQEEREK